MLLRFFKPGVLALAGVFIMLSADCFGGEPGKTAYGAIAEVAELSASGAATEEIRRESASDQSPQPPQGTTGEEETAQEAGEGQTGQETQEVGEGQIRQPGQKTQEAGEGQTGQEAQEAGESVGAGQSAETQGTQNSGQPADAQEAQGAGQSVGTQGAQSAGQSAGAQNVAQPSQASVQHTVPERPMTRRERREERRRIKNEPLDLPELRREGFRVSGGLRSGAFNVDSVRLRTADSLAVIAMGDTVRLDSLGNIIRPFRMPESEVVLQEHAVDGSTLTISGTRTNMPDSVEISKKEWREMQRIAARGDTTLFRHSPLFRDTIPISRMAAISVVAPGFGQLYNGDYWKIPILYATTGTSIYFAVQQSKKFRSYKSQYQAWEQSIYDTGGDIYDRTEIDPIQKKMILHNTYRQLLWAGAFASYVYFIGDGVINYPAQNTQVKVATTLSTIFPGAGQFYNGSYWKGPIVVGVFASMAYVIDWNNRGYQRFERAYQTYPNNEFSQYVSPPSQANLKVYRDSYRRNRDLSIIITAAAYIMNIIDAHVDAHLRDYDVSDDLSWKFSVVPMVDYVYTPMTGAKNVIGLGFNFTF